MVARTTFLTLQQMNSNLSVTSAWLLCLVLSRDSGGLRSCRPSLMAGGLQRQRHPCSPSGLFYVFADNELLLDSSLCKPFLAFSSLPFLTAKSSAAASAKSEGRVIAALISAFCHWVTYASSLVIIGSLRLGDVCGTRDAGFQIPIQLLALHDV